MSALKSKLFKKIFEANADDVVSIEGTKESVMTQDTFVPLMGQMWERAKNKYKKRYIKKTFQFVEWTHKHFYIDCDRWQPLHKEDNYPTDLKIDKLFEIWKKEQ